MEPLAARKEEEFRQPDDWSVVATPDGSATLDSGQIKEHYHSLFGAATEGRHVFIGHGLLAAGHRAPAILEVGLGTGLNAILTWAECRDRGMEMHYTALEPFPLKEELWGPLGHAQALGRPELENDHRRMMNAKPGTAVELGGGSTFTWLAEKVQDLAHDQAYDVVYYDAFAPHAQPGMWTDEVFRRVCRAMRPGAVLVTYCAKGEVRRAMQRAGLEAERLPGPPGKREMLRATRPK